MNDLSRFIEQQRQAGRVESAGHFTLAIEKARDKLGSYSLAESSDYILKIVQCAVSIGSRAVDLVLDGRSVLAYFEVEDTEQGLSVERLTGSLLNPIDEKHPSRSHLTLGLADLVGREPQELMWGDWATEVSGLVLSLGRGRSEIFREVPFPRTVPLEKGRRLHLLYLDKGLDSAGQTTVEQKVIAERCGYSKTQVRLNQRLVPAALPLTGSKGDQVYMSTSPYYGALRVLTDDRPELCWYTDEIARRKLESEAQSSQNLTRLIRNSPPIFRLQTPGFELPLPWQFQFTALYGIPAHLHGHSQLHYVRDGVLCKPLDIHKAGGGAFAILSGRLAKTDITGLAIVRDDRIERDIEEGVLIWKELVNDFVNNSPPVFRSEQSGKVGRFLGPLVDQVYQRLGNKKMNSKQFQHHLNLRRSSLDYFRQVSYE